VSLRKGWAMAFRSPEDGRLQLEGSQSENPEVQIFRHPGFGTETWQNKVKVEDLCSPMVNRYVRYVGVIWFVSHVL
jgi:hypothetical protein